MTLTAFPFTKHLLNSLSKRPKQPSFPWQRVLIIHQTKTMKKKVIIKVPMNDEKPQNKAMKVVARVLGLIVICRLLRKYSDSHSIVNKNKSRAMTIAVGLPGVESASLKGQEKNELEVIGDKIDAVELTNLLRKKIGFAQIMNVSAVDEKKAETKTETKTENEPKLNYYYPCGGVPHYQVFEYPMPSCFF